MIMEGRVSRVKYLILALIFMTVSIQLYAESGAPQGFNYQAVVRNSSGSIVASSPVGLKFNIHTGSPTGSVVYTQADTVITTPDGIFTIVIGGGNITGGFDSIRWANNTFYLQVMVDIDGGNNYLDMGTSQMVSVPYALYARTAGALALTPTVLNPITGNDSIIVGTNSLIVVNSAVVPSLAQVTLSPGVYAGQMLSLVGSSSTNNGVTIVNGGLINIGTSGPNTLMGGGVLTMVWSGAKWLKVAYSPNQ